MGLWNKSCEFRGLEERSSETHFVVNGRNRYFTTLKKTCLYHLFFIGIMMENQPEKYKEQDDTSREASPQEDSPLYQIRDATSSSIHSEPASPVKPSDTPPKEVSDQTNAFFITLGVLLLILVAIFLIPRFFNSEAKTLDDLHEETLTENKDTETAYPYNGYSFVYYDGLWYTQIQNAFSGGLYDIPLHYGPRDLTDIVVTGDFDPFFISLGGNNISNYTLQTYLTFDPADENMGYVALATGELTQNIASTFGIAFIPACIEEDEGCETVPIVTCNSTDAPVIFLTSGEPTVVYADGNCITLQGTGTELVRAADRFILKLYNVMI